MDFGPGLYSGWSVEGGLKKILDPPRPLSPGSSSAPGPRIDTLTPTFRWEGVSDADYYALAISEYPYGSGHVIYRNEQIYGTSFVLPSGVLEYEEKYRWNMQAYGNGQWSDVSSLLHFQTPLQQLDPPRPLSPGSSSAPGPRIDTLTPTFRWEGVSDADYYALAISEYPYGSGHVIYRNEQISRSP